MTPTDDVSENLRKLDALHREDSDGGYALLGDVLTYARTLSDNDKDILRRELLRLVDAQDRTMWGVALESLVQAWNSEISTELDSLLNLKQHTDEWDAQVLMALLRLQYHPIAKRAVAHISKRITVGDRTVLPLLAALCKVDAVDCLKMTAPFLISLVNSRQIDKLSGYIPAIVNHFMDTDPSLFALLIRRIAEKDNDVCSQVAQLFCEYLDRPYVTDRLGEAQIKVLKQSIDAACAGQ